MGQSSVRIPILFMKVRDTYMILRYPDPKSQLQLQCLFRVILASHASEERRIISSFMQLISPEQLMHIIYERYDESRAYTLDGSVANKRNI